MPRRSSEADQTIGSTAISWVRLLANALLPLLTDMDVRAVAVCYGLLVYCVYGELHLPLPTGLDADSLLSSLRPRSMSTHASKRR
jgi:hypothetical protein